MAWFSRLFFCRVFYYFIQNKNFFGFATWFYVAYDVLTANFFPWKKLCFKEGTIPSSSMFALLCSDLKRLQVKLQEHNTYYLYVSVWQTQWGASQDMRTTLMWTSSEWFFIGRGYCRFRQLITSKKVKFKKNYIPKRIIPAGVVLLLHFIRSETNLPWITQLLYLSLEYPQAIFF